MDAAAERLQAFKTLLARRPRAAGPADRLRACGTARPCRPISRRPPLRSSSRTRARSPGSCAGRGSTRSRTSGSRSASTSATAPSSISPTPARARRCAPSDFLKTLDKWGLARLAWKFWRVDRGGPWPLEEIPKEQPSSGDPKENKENIAYHYDVSNAFYAALARRGDGLHLRLLHRLGQRHRPDAAGQARDHLPQAAPEARREAPRHRLRLGRAVLLRGAALRRHGLRRDALRAAGRLCAGQDQAARPRGEGQDRAQGLLDRRGRGYLRQGRGDRHPGAYRLGQLPDLLRHRAAPDEARRPLPPPRHHAAGEEERQGVPARSAPSSRS